MATKPICLKPLLKTIAIIERERLAVQVLRRKIKLIARVVKATLANSGSGDIVSQARREGRVSLAKRINEILKG